MDAFLRHPPVPAEPGVSGRARRTHEGSIRLAWAITVGESVVLGALAVGLDRYWLMLPVWLRSGGACGLAALAGLAIARLVRFHRRANPPKG